MLWLIAALAVVGVLAYGWWQARRGPGSVLESRSHPLQNDQLEALFARLARTAGDGEIRVLVMPDRNINALISDRGDLFISEGIIDRLRMGDITAREIAAIGAHELGHLALGHVKQRALRDTGQRAAGMAAGALLGRLVPFVGGMAADWLLARAAERLTARDEFDADAYATALMIRSGLGAEAQIEMLERLEGMYDAIWTNQHPPTADRVARIRENVARWAGEAPPVT